MATKKRRVLYANDATESVPLLLKLRLPWLFIGFIMSLGTALVVSRFEEILSSDARIAFFIPLIVYISAAAGTQTSAIYIHNLNKKQAGLKVYIVKELVLGIITGAILGILLGIITALWLQSTQLALAVGIATIIAVTTATVFAIAISALLRSTKTDPAASSEPIISVVQDILSLVIYFYVVSLIMN